MGEIAAPYIHKVHAWQREGHCTVSYYVCAYAGYHCTCLANTRSHVKDVSHRMKVLLRSCVTTTTARNPHRYQSYRYSGSYCLLCRLIAVTIDRSVCTDPEENLSNDSVQSVCQDLTWFTTSIFEEHGQAGRKLTQPVLRNRHHLSIQHKDSKPNIFLE